MLAKSWQIHPSPNRSGTSQYLQGNTDFICKKIIEHLYHQNLPWLRGFREHSNTASTHRQFRKVSLKPGSRWAKPRSRKLRGQLHHHNQPGTRGVRFYPTQPQYKDSSIPTQPHYLNHQSLPYNRWVRALSNSTSSS